MRTRPAAPALLAVATLLAAAVLGAGCGGAQPPSADPSSAGPPSSGPSSAAPAGPPTGALTPTLPRKEPAVTPPAGDDRRGDLVHGVRTLTGTVERTGGCVLLRVGAARWELTGAAARTLVAGRRVRVGGAPLPTPPQCGATGVFAVSRWTPAAS